MNQIVLFSHGHVHPLCYVAFLPCLSLRSYIPSPQTDSLLYYLEPHSRVWEKVIVIQVGFYLPKEQFREKGRLGKFTLQQFVSTYNFSSFCCLLGHSKQCSGIMHVCELRECLAGLGNNWACRECTKNSSIQCQYFTCSSFALRESTFFWWWWGGSISE